MHALTALAGLLVSLGGTASRAGIGDWDPGYGEGGRLTAATAFYDPSISLRATALMAVQLPDDRLMTVEGGLVRRFDATGHPDLTFGDSGMVGLPALPAPTPTFDLLFEPLVTPDGGLLLAALLRNDEGTMHFEALIRLDRDGKILTSFGGHGDGLFLLTDGPMPEICDGGGLCTELTSVSVDPAGRVLLAKRGWSALGRCSAAPHVQRLTPDGLIDSTFGSNGEADVTGIDLCAGALVLGARQDGSVVVGGSGVVMGLDARGARDASFGSAGLLSLDSSFAWSSALLTPDGRLLLAGTRNPATGSGTVLVRFNASGQPDASFGGGTGSVPLDLGKVFPGWPRLQPLVTTLVSTVDTKHLYLQVAKMCPNSLVPCAGGVARLLGNGTLDPSFGRQGFTSLDYGRFPFRLIAAQRNGAPLFGELDGSIYRLLVDDAPSPGFITLVAKEFSRQVREGAGAEISVGRLAGHDGPVSASYATAQCVSSHPRDYWHFVCATAGTDFSAVSGRLDWADGDEGERTMSVAAIPDQVADNNETFSIGLQGISGGALELGSGNMYVQIVDADAATAGSGVSGSGVNGGGVTSGGGGSMGFVSLLVLAAAALLSRAPTRLRRRWPRRVLTPPRAQQFTRIVALATAIPFAVLPPASLGAPGDLDPSFGDFGRVVFDSYEVPAWSAQTLDNGGTLIAGGGTYIRCSSRCDVGRYLDATNFAIRLTTDGAVDPTFSPARPQSVQVLDAALAPDGSGKIIAVGATGVENSQVLTVFRLLRGGALDATFGKDGLFSLFAIMSTPHHATSVVFDPDGRIVVAGTRGNRDRPWPIVLRLQPNGVLDESFGEAGTWTSSVLMPPNGDSRMHILRTAAGGYRVGTPDCRITGLTAEGKLDLTFGAGGTVQVTPVSSSVSCHALAAQSDGRLLVGGTEDASKAFLVRVFANGAADGSFVAMSVAATMAEATALAAGADGSVVVAGTRHVGLSGDVVMRLHVDGSLDTAFGHDGSAIVDLPTSSNSSPIIHDMYLRPDNSIVAAGGDSSAFVVRLLGTGGAGQPGVLGFSPPYVDAAEQDGEAIVRIQRTGGSAGTVSVAYQTVGNAEPAASAGQDYTSSSGRLTWDDGDVSDKEIRVPILADTAAEGDEYFGVTLSDPQGGAGLAAQDATVDIGLGGSPHGQFEITVLNSSFIAEGGKAEFFVNRNKYSSGAVAVTLTPVSGTATAATDFTATPVTVSWADGETDPKLVQVAVTDDSLQEPDESFSVLLGNPTGGAVLGAASMATMTIQANDQPTPPASGSNSDGGGGSMGFASLLFLAVATLLRSRWPRRLTSSKFLRN